MTDGRVSQLAVRGLTEGSDAQLSQLAVRSVYGFPSEAARVSQLTVRSLDEPAPLARVSQLLVRAIVRGRVENPRVRVWTYSLDGHDYYVIQLGETQTLVYDIYSEQWMEFGNRNTGLWRAQTGINWFGGSALADIYGSNVVAGDDTLGVLWFLDPNQPYDQDPSEDADVQQIYFDRVVQGQVPLRGRDTMPCFTAWLTSDMGDPAYEGAGVRLEISDDAGKSYEDMGLITVTLDDNRPELAWYSLGQIEAPGRLFKITDDGAIVRIDSFEMNDPEDEDSEGGR